MRETEERMGKEAQGEAAAFLVWLEWPERCFRASDADIDRLRSLVPQSSKILRARSEGEFLALLPQATHAIVWNFKKEWFDLAPRLRLLATPAAGRELLPEEAPPGVAVHFGGFHGATMAESVAAFVLGWARGFFRPELRTSKWPRSELAETCTEVRGTRAVVAGYGKVGRAIGETLETLGVSVAGFTRHGVHSGGKILPASALDGFLAEADWLVLALPSTTGTDDFLDEKTISKLPRRCVVANVGRGNAIDEEALCRALEEGRLAGAYLDVRRSEPTAAALERPGFCERLASLPNCVAMPHSSAFSPRYVQTCFEELAAAGLLR